MIMAFLLVVIVNNDLLNEEFYFRDITRCNQFAFWIETGQVNLVQRKKKQNNVSAYCVPKKVRIGTKTWD